MIPRIKHADDCAIFTPPCLADCDCGAWGAMPNIGLVPMSIEGCVQNDMRAARVVPFPIKLKAMVKCWPMWSRAA